MFSTVWNCGVRPSFRRHAGCQGSPRFVHGLPLWIASVVSAACTSAGYESATSARVGRTSLPLPLPLSLLSLLPLLLSSSSSSVSSSSSSFSSSPSPCLPLVTGFGVCATEQNNLTKHWSHSAGPLPSPSIRSKTFILLGHSPALPPSFRRRCHNCPSGLCRPWSKWTLVASRH